MDQKRQFYTLKGYQLNETVSLTPAMEDYLEMIYRILSERKVVRIGELAKMLHVASSSASKMVRQLHELGLVAFEKYGYVQMTEKGLAQGGYLLYRHEVLHTFLCLLNGSQEELEQVEKIEHFLNRETIHNLELLTQEMKKKKTMAPEKTAP